MRRADDDAEADAELMDLLLGRDLRVTPPDRGEVTLSHRYCSRHLSWPLQLAIRRPRSAAVAAAIRAAPTKAPLQLPPRTTVRFSVRRPFTTATAMRASARWPPHSGPGPLAEVQAIADTAISVSGLSCDLPTRELSRRSWLCRPIPLPWHTYLRT